MNKKIKHHPNIDFRKKDFLPSRRAEMRVRWFSCNA